MDNLKPPPENPLKNSRYSNISHKPRKSLQKNQNDYLNFRDSYYSTHFTRNSSKSFCLPDQNPRFKKITNANLKQIEPNLFNLQQKLNEFYVP